MNEWFKTPLGNSIVSQERQKCTQLVPSGYYARSLQIGVPWVNYCADITVSTRFVIDTEYPVQATYGRSQTSDSLSSAEPIVDTQCYYAVSSSNALPFPEKTHDLIVLPHTLDFCAEPHGVLRQASQILVAKGCIVIIGFNLVSFYGMTKLFKKTKKNIGHDGHYYRVGRVQDWLALLGFDLVGAAMTVYRPPIQSKKWRARLTFIEQIGDRWWPGLGGVYVIVGQKREIAVSTLPKSTHKWHRLVPAIAQTASQCATKTDLNLVTKN